MGGEIYSGPPILIGTSCTSAEGGGGGTTSVTVPDPFGADNSDDDAAYEIVVYGDPIHCSSQDMITGADNMCVIVNH